MGDGLDELMESLKQDGFVESRRGSVFDNGAQGAGDLDELMASLSTTNENQAPENFDDLLSSLTAPKGALDSSFGAPRQQSVYNPSARGSMAQENRQTKKIDDLDELLGTINSAPTNNNASTRSSVASSHNNYEPRASQRETVSLDATLDDLLGGLPTRTSPRPPVSARSKNAARYAEEARPVSSMVKDLSTQLSDVVETDSKKGKPQGTCDYCKKEIYGDAMGALGKKYHVDHWLCFGCNVQLRQSQYYENNGKPYCPKCYLSLQAPRCGMCAEPITDKCVNALGKKWHVNHFVCATCQQPFVGGQFYNRDGKPYCQIHAL